MGDRIVLGNLAIDLERFNVSVEGRRVPVTFSEFELLAVLAREPGRVVSRDHLVQAVWGNAPNAEHRLNVQICRLRKKLRGSHPWRITTVRKRGYVFDAAAEGQRAAS
jgi:DNA-binding response OmpR family regulator